MGYIRKLDANVDIQTFPGAKFVINDTVPAAQCSEAQIESETGDVGLEETRIDDTGKFTGWNLAGKKVTVTSPASEAGTYNIISNTNDRLVTDHTFDDYYSDVHYYVHNGGELILTRDEASFAAYIHAAGYAYTFKGGKLFTDMPNGQLKNACTILFDPLP